MNEHEDWLYRSQRIIPLAKEISEAPMTITINLNCEVGDMFPLEDCSNIREESLYDYCDGDTRQDAWGYVAEKIYNKFELDRQNLHDLIDRYFNNEYIDVSLDIHLWE